MPNTADTVIALGDPNARVYESLRAATLDAIAWEGGSVVSIIDGTSAWQGIAESSTWIAATVPVDRIAALRCALRIVARRFGQDGLALTVGLTTIVEA